MLELSYKTKGNAQPKGKPRVFFTCHPADLERSLDRLCSDLFQAQDCAVYYTSNMNELIGDEDRALQLEQMNLFVIPVSLKLLIEPNRAMDLDVPFARDKHIPILPIMLEPGLDVVYSREDKFGPLQYLDPEAHDITAISYEEKLKKYLSSVLIDDETAERVRKAFDAYIFLSYRKKDRRYANELMRLIHADPQCRDIAIWYDEYLTPGESFSDAIQAALDKSELFTLLVTPNLVNEENYIQTTEYPAAKQSGKPILPVEMEHTDRKALESHYYDIPQCTTPDDDQFRTRLLDSLRHIALRENDTDSTHNYLIGLAYLDGIDVEVNKDRGIELITSAAEADLSDAIRKLMDMYQEGSGVKLDYLEAVRWAQRLVDYYISRNGKRNPDTLIALNDLATSYGYLGDAKKMLELSKEAYSLMTCVLGNTDTRTLTALGNLTVSYIKLGEYQKAREAGEKLYSTYSSIHEENHSDVIDTNVILCTLAHAHAGCGEYTEALELYEKAYSLGVQSMGEEHPQTLISLNHMAALYRKIGKYKISLELSAKAYSAWCHIDEENHPGTIAALSILASAYESCGEYTKALELHEKAYSLGVQSMGEKHPDTLSFLNNLAIIYGKLGEFNKSLELMESVYIQLCHIEGEKHPNSLNALNNLAILYFEQKKYSKAKEIFEKTYPLHSQILGEEHPATLSIALYLAETYVKLGQTRNAQKLFSKTARITNKKKKERSRK